MSLAPISFTEKGCATRTDRPVSQLENLRQKISVMKRDQETGRIFTINLKVRDYELDQYGVVNNAIYNHYLEHARHEFLAELGIDAAAVAASGRSLALSRLDVTYRASLRSKDHFRVEVFIAKLSGARVGFCQRIHRLPDDTLMLEAMAEAAFLDEKGRPQRIQTEHKHAFQLYLMTTHPSL